MEFGISGANLMSTTEKFNTTFNSIHYENQNFLAQKTELAIPSTIILVIAAVVGTFGNVLILLCVSSRKNLQNIESIFIVNLATSDLFVTSIADPMSIVAKIEGEEFFEKIPGLCQTVASICTISCMTSMMTIATMSINRYFCICSRDKYVVIFTKRNSICICLSLYLVGGVFVLLNAGRIGDHGFDKKSLECIWDRMATFPYTVVFSIFLVWIPSFVTGACYLGIFLYVRGHWRRVRERNLPVASSPFQKNIHLARTLFIIYAVFIACWAPYALLIVIDSQDTFPYEIHVCITVFAHLHPSVNWLVYYITNRKFAEAYKALLSKFKRCHFKFTNTSDAVLIPDTIGYSSQGRQSYSLHESRGELKYDGYCRDVRLATTEVLTCHIGDTSFKTSRQTVPEVDC